MKDSKNKLKKSSSESKILEKKTVPTMPKDKRTKEYKEWYKKYGMNSLEDKNSQTKKKESTKQKKEVLDVPQMPRDKRTKEYKEWHKKYGKNDIKSTTPEKLESKKGEFKVAKKITLKDLVILFDDKINSDKWVSERKAIEEIKKTIDQLFS